MTRRLTILLLYLSLTATVARVFAHDPSSVPITWNREVSRVMYQRCVVCHREGGTSFPLVTYQDVQPRAVAIKDAVLSRRMPPWGAVKGFGHFRDEEGLPQDQIEIITLWVEGGMMKGNNPNALPKPPAFKPVVPFQVPDDALKLTEGLKISTPTVVAGIYPLHVPAGATMQITATYPGGAVEPLIWLYQYRDADRHPFWYRHPLTLPAGTVIRGVNPSSTIALLPRERGGG